MFAWSWQDDLTWVVGPLKFMYPRWRPGVMSAIVKILTIRLSISCMAMTGRGITEPSQLYMIILAALGFSVQEVGAGCHTVR